MDVDKAKEILKKLAEETESLFGLDYENPDFRRRRFRTTEHLIALSDQEIIPNRYADQLQEKAFRYIGPTLGGDFSDIHEKITTVTCQILRIFLKQRLNFLTPMGRIRRLFC